MDDARLLWRLSAGLEQVGGEDGRQFVAGHVVEVGTLLNPVCESVARALVKDAESLSRIQNAYKGCKSAVFVKATECLQRMNSV